MKILFLASSNTRFAISPIVKNQGESLRKLDIDVSYYTLRGKGLKGYLKAIPQLRKHLKANQYQIIHAHYALVGIVTSLAGARPVVVSLMGSDVYEYWWLRWSTRIFSRFFWSATIVKSHAMKDYLRLPKAQIIPNGVDMDTFRPYSKLEIRKHIPLFDIPTVIFIGNPDKREKNLELAIKVTQSIKSINFQFKPLFNIEHSLIPYYMNAASVLLMTSLWEGSPNVIKEAMACNLPVVTVDVGDVKEVIGTTEGCFISSHNSDELAKAVIKALQFDRRTDGRDKMQYLTSDKIAKRLIALYKNLAY